MKKTDIATLILIVSIVALIVFFTLKVVVGDQTMKPVEVKVAQPIGADVVPTSPTVFSETAINPTVPITIEGGDQKPIGN